MTTVTICIPTFNRSELLKSAIDSVFQQSYQDWELIVCDDGSTDETANLMSHYQDHRVHYIRHSHNIGKSNNMRSGFQAGVGEYFIKFDDDDRLTPEFIAQTTAILDADQSIDFVGTDHWIIDSDNVRDHQESDRNSQRWGRTNLPEGVVGDLLEVVFVKQSFQIGATLFRRKTLQDVGFMQPNMQNCEDNDLFIRLALAGKKGYYLPERLMEYRFHAEQKGINRAIAYLTDKLNYLASYQFESENLETIRKARMAETQLLLGLRLIETGQNQKGRQLVLAGRSASRSKAGIGLMLSLLPVGLRRQVFNLLRQLK